MRAADVVVRPVRCGDDATLAGLTDVLCDCVEGGASVSFLMPLTRERAMAFWTAVMIDVEAARRALFIATDERGVCGTVQLILDLPENQPHRADLAKMLVHRRARRCGVGARLLRAAEEDARSRGRTMLVLDTASEVAERLYAREGWVRVGSVPRFALLPDGGACETTFYYRDLSDPSRAPSRR